jgi:glucose/mannose transport system permease protein
LWQAVARPPAAPWFENFALDPKGNVMTTQANAVDFRTRLQDFIPKLVLAPSLGVMLVFVYGFIAYTVYLSFTASKMLPNTTLVGMQNYTKLFALDHWHTAIHNIAIFASLYIIICTAIGLMLAIFLDQKIRGEGVLRPIYLYPMALSFIVTGTAWKWFLDPGLGLENTLHLWGWTSFSFHWIKDSNMAIYTIVIAAVWQTSGFVMAMFLAGLRGIDNEILKAAQIDGASTWQLYRRIVIPMLRPAFLSAFVILSHLAIKSYDLVIALTGGGPGRSTELPATFMYSYTFTRNQMGIGAASAVVMLMTIAAIMIPYLYAELRERGQ